MKRHVLFLLIVLLFPGGSLLSQSPVIQQIIDSVRVDSLMFHIKELSGEEPTVINGTTKTILSRHNDQPGNALAEAYVKQKLESYGLPVTLQNYSAVGTNVLATQVGTVFPNRKVILCAHYDDMPEGPIAPGADDNASGTACVLEAARVLAQHSFPLTIVYALWDQEEITVYPSGSTYYATQASAAGDSILCVINLDAIGKDSDNNGVCAIIELPNVRSVNIRDDMTDLAHQYGLQLHIVAEPASGSSDHAPFWYQGYDAIQLWNSALEANWNYHTTNDRVAALNSQQYLERVRLVSATVAFFALALNFDITHSPVTAVVPPEPTTAEVSIHTFQQIGSGPRAPRLYYRTKPWGGGYGAFAELVGTTTGSGKYEFTVPALSNGTGVQYYVAAQDENSTAVRTSPVGGGGFSPPGSTPPGAFHEFLVADLKTIWSDSANSLEHWTATGGWNATTEQSVSPPTSFTDSPGGNYPTNSHAMLTCKDQIPAQNSQKTFLEFDTRWTTEAWVAFGQAQISIDGGGTWSSLGGQHSYVMQVPPSYFTAPVYSGMQSSWVHEVCDISTYAKYPFRIRYAFVSDIWTYFMPMDGWYIDNVKISILENANSADAYVQLPTAFSLAQNYPNPFNPSTTIKYELPKSSVVRLSVYDMLGREVSVLVNERKDAGSHVVNFDASGLAGGVYLYRLQAGDLVQSKKLVLLR